VTSGLNESTALFEARRCISCGNCFGCDNCYSVCPDNAIVKLGDGQYEIDYDYLAPRPPASGRRPPASVRRHPRHPEAPGHLRLASVGLNQLNSG
jgi:ferredoxin